MYGSCYCFAASMSALLNDLVDFAGGRIGQIISISLSPRVDLVKGLASVVYNCTSKGCEY